MASGGASGGTLGIVFVLGLAAGAGVAHQTKPSDPLAEAVEAVADGDLSAGCAALEKVLPTPDPPDEATSAVAACVEPRISEAFAIDDPVRRELTLLALAAPAPGLRPTDEQLSRIEREADKLPGAIEDKKGRLRAVSFQVQGPHATDAVRELFQGARLALRGCHATAVLADPKLVGHYAVSVSIGADGTVSNVADTDVKTTTKTDTVAKSNRLTECLRDVLTQHKTTSASAASVAVVEMELRPVSL